MRAFSLFLVQSAIFSTIGLAACGKNSQNKNAVDPGPNKNTSEKNSDSATNQKTDPQVTTQDKQKNKENELFANFKSVAVGFNLGCGLTPESGVKCWNGFGFRDENEGQLGNGTFKDSPKAVKVSGLDKGVKSLAIGSDFACALLENGTVKCWGSNSKGKLGNHSFVNSNVPVEVKDVINAKLLKVASDTACALTEKGELFCWGKIINEYHSINNPLVPNQKILLPDPISSFEVQDDFACAITSKKELFCWGDNYRGQLGWQIPPKSKYENRYAPQKVVLPPDFGLPEKVVLGNHRDACAISEGGALACWGNYLSVYDQVKKERSFKEMPPTVIPQGAPIRDIVLLSGAICSIRRDDTVWCWGDNSNGLIGQSGTNFSEVPIQNADIKDPVQSLFHNYGTACALTKTKVFFCWGENSFGALGSGTNIKFSNKPIFPAGISEKIIEVSSDSDTAIAVLTETGKAYWWGYTLGGGDAVGAVTYSNLPTLVKE